MPKVAFSGQMYQLSAKTKLPAGSYVRVNGPWDTYGVVLSATSKPDGSFLHSIRGVRKRMLEKPVASF